AFRPISPVNVAPACPVVDRPARPGARATHLLERHMLKKILVILALLYAAASFAPVDVNKATAAELDAIKGIGPVMSQRIIDERKKGDFKNWDDLVTRVKGIGSSTAAKYSAGGLTVKGEQYKRLDAKEDKAAKSDK